MSIPEKALAILLSALLALSLASCAQGQVNEDRLPGGVPGGQGSGDGTQGSATGGAQEDEDLYPPGLDDYADVRDSTFEDTRSEPGGGTLLYTVTSVELYDSLEAAGISEESYAVAGEEKYDHYIKIDMTIQNVDITDISHDFSINSFDLQCQHYMLEPVWFSLGGLEDEDGRGYFHYKLPPTGESMEISVAWGLEDSKLTKLRDAGSIWLTYGINVWQKMKLEGLL